jgi:hypothetical protein
LVKRKRLSTLAEVTVGTAQERQDKTKRKIKPTNRLGTNVALKGRQHLYATESATYQKNRALLIIPKSKTVPDILAFPVDGNSINSNDLTNIYDGVHSDLFELLFQTLPTDSQYRVPGPNPGNCFGPLLLSGQDHPAAFPALDTHVDDSLYLSSLYHNLTFEKRTDLLYVHWDTLHAFTSVLEIKKWLESLAQSDHLLLIQLHAA